ncbi:hypothetical protein ACWFRF_14330 [Nocardia sp. NPDC055165]
MPNPDYRDSDPARIRAYTRHVRDAAPPSEPIDRDFTDTVFEGVQIPDAIHRHASGALTEIRFKSDRSGKVRDWFATWR